MDAEMQGCGATATNKGRSWEVEKLGS